MACNVFFDSVINLHNAIYYEIIIKFIDKISCLKLSNMVYCL